jgi:hypothetical protein
MRWRGSGCNMVSAQNVRYIDFGYTTAEQYWCEVAWPAYERFKTAPNRRHAIEASLPAWHILDWIWHEEHHGQDTSGDAFNEFRKNILDACPQLGWIRDVAEAGKHRGLGRQRPAIQVQKVSSRRRFSGAISGAPIGALSISGNGLGRLMIVLDGDVTHDFSDVLSCVVGYWQENWFAT